MKESVPIVSSPKVGNIQVSLQNLAEKLRPMRAGIVPDPAVNSNGPWFVVQCDNSFVPFEVIEHTVEASGFCKIFTD